MALCPNVLKGHINYLCDLDILNLYLLSYFIQKALGVWLNWLHGTRKRKRKTWLFLFFKMLGLCLVTCAAYIYGQVFKSFFSHLFPGTSLGWRGIVLQKRPPTSPPCLFLVPNAFHYFKQHKHTMSEGIWRKQVKRSVVNYSCI